MGKSLVIAEKPSVATDIARVLKAPRDKSKDFFENDDYVISSAVGHLLTIIVPPDQDIKRGKWTLDKLPHIPTHFDLEPIAKSETRLRVLLRLIKRDDIDSLVNACDAGREGELIFRYIIQYARAKHPKENGGQGHLAALAAVDDAGRDPHRLRQSAQRRRHESAGQRRQLPE